MPVDGANISRSFCAAGRELPFPVGINHEAPAMANEQGQAALKHVEAHIPLLMKQHQLLNLLNEERRERHRQLKNKGKKQHVFQAGDLVLVCRQLQSDSEKGFSKKLVFQSKGPHHVLEKVRDTSCIAQCLSFLEGSSSVRKPLKELAAHMEKIPSTIVSHKQADGTDAHFTVLRSPMVQPPLEKWLSVQESGVFQKAQGRVVKHTNSTMVPMHALLMQKGCLNRSISRSESRGEGESRGSHGGSFCGSGTQSGSFLGFPWAAMALVAVLESASSNSPFQSHV